ncbi:helix-turn-helix domain-containing protein [Enemella sp. A6]|uniref:helix-turn-helix domain-containing protein n=1 Tax=Enemella sp. A6 TaxID=3440152 RepID=UPI003EB6B877
MSEGSGDSMARDDDVGRLLDAARAGDAPSLDELARRAHFSRFHLSRLLKKHLGFPLREFIAAAKVDRSIDGLVTGHSVTRSQTDAGHESPSSFHRAFLRHTGMSPSAYRRQMRMLATQLMRHQDDPEPLVVLHRKFDPAAHRQPHPLTIRIEGAGPHSALFAALHPEQLVKGEPLLGMALLGTGEYDVTAIPDGTYYAMVVEIPRATDLRCYFQMDHNRRQLQRVPVTFPLAGPTTVTLHLRDRIPQDPPITVNLPRLFFQAVAGQVDVELGAQQ